jgi:hypothetical protein
VLSTTSYDLAYRLVCRLAFRGRKEQVMTVSTDIKCVCGANYTSIGTISRAVAPARRLHFLPCLRQFCRSWTLESGLRMSKGTFALIALVTIVVGPTIAFAEENRWTAEQRTACTPDALRLCAGPMFDASKVERCLRTKKGELSAACRSVFEPSPGLVATRSK